MKIFLDSEFHEYRPFLSGIDTIELISLGMVKENGEELYLISKDFNTVPAMDNKWLRDNVLKNIFEEFSDGKEYFNWVNFSCLIQNIGFHKNEIRKKIEEFVGDDEPQFYGYYSSYDWVVFCWLFGRMIDLPRNFPMYCRDLKQMCDEKCEKTGVTTKYLKSLPDYPKNDNDHNALSDARWNKKLYEFLQKNNYEVE